MDNENAEVDAEIRETWDREKQLSPLQLLAVMREAVEQEELAMNFDYARLMLHCHDLIGALHQHMAPVLVASRRREGRSERVLEMDIIKEIVDDLLWGSALEEADGQNRPHDRCGLHWLRAFAGTINRTIEEKGSVCYVTALAMCGGHLDDSLIPEKNKREGKEELELKDMFVDVRGSEVVLRRAEGKEPYRDTMRRYVNNLMAKARGKEEISKEECARWAKDFEVGADVAGAER